MVYCRSVIMKLIVYIKENKSGVKVYYEKEYCYFIQVTCLTRLNCFVTFNDARL